MLGNTLKSLALISILSHTGFATETAVDVRVIAKGAKFIGSSIGGAEIVIRDAQTGAILATGKTRGSTGDTAKIMKEENRAHAPLSTEGASVFHATLDLNEPRLVEVNARGPLAQLQATAKASVTLWVVPGKPITGGDGVLLEIPGLVVDVLAPPCHVFLPENTTSVALRANVTMMCGCPIHPEKPWKPVDFEVAAFVSKDGGAAKTVPLEFSGDTSRFSAELSVDGPGVYRVVVYAHEANTGNTGVDETSFIIKPTEK